MPLKPVNAPVLALDIRPRHVHAALLLPGAQTPDLYRLTLPLAFDAADAPEIPIVPQGLSDAAKKPAASQGLSDAVEISAVPYEEAFTAAFWQGILAAAGQPPATAVLAAGTGLDAPAAREAFFRRVFAASSGGGAELSCLRAGEAPEELLRLSQIQRISEFPITDGFCASLLGVLANPLVQARSFREGLTIVRLEEDRAFVALVFQDKLFAVAERRFCAQEAIPAFLEDLDSFRLAWLPQEKMRAVDGYSVVPSELPAEAEGFRPLYIAGPGAKRLHGHGVAVDLGGDVSIFRGLLYGL